MEGTVADTMQLATAAQVVTVICTFQTGTTMSWIQPPRSVSTAGKEPLNQGTGKTVIHISMAAGSIMTDMQQIDIDQAHLMGGKELTEHLLSALVMTDMTAEIEGQSRMTGSILCGAIGMTHLLSVH